MDENARATDAVGATFRMNEGIHESARATGVYEAVLRDKDGNVKWEDVIENVVTTPGRNLALDTFLAGSAYTVTGPFMGLISSVSFGAGPVAADTMSSHAGWTEAGNANAPQYTAPRKIAAWNAASGATKALSAGLVFSFTAAGTVKGAFLAYGAGAVSTIDNTAGTLYSAGLFAGGDRTVASTDTLTISYTAGM